MSLTHAGRPGCQHQVQILYELELPQDVIPKPCDGEVEKYGLKTLAEFQDALVAGDFKWNCAMTWRNDMDGIFHSSRHCKRRKRTESGGDLLPTRSQARYLHYVKKKTLEMGLGNITIFYRIRRAAQ